MIKEALVIILLLAVGLMVGLHLQGVPVVSTVGGLVEPLITGAQSTWNAIPAPIRGLIPLAIPTIFALFFAWTKTRAMNKLQETKILASQQTNQLQGELTEAQAVNTNLQGTIKTLSSQPSGTSSLELREALLNIETKDTKIKDLEDKIHALQTKVDELKLKIYALEIRLKELTTAA